VLHHLVYHDQANVNNDKVIHFVEYLLELLLMNVFHNHYNYKIYRLIDPMKKKKQEILKKIKIYFTFVI